jgi:hypothetical protein
MSGVLSVPPFKGSHPIIVAIDDKSIPLMSFGYMANKDKRQAKAVATNLRDSIGGFADLLPPLPANGSTDDITWWLLCTQCELLRCANLTLSPQSFGAPVGFNGVNPGRGRGLNGGA